MDGEKNVADEFSKALDGHTFDHFRRALGLCHEDMIESVAPQLDLP